MHTATAVPPNHIHLRLRHFWSVQSHFHPILTSLQHIYFMNLHAAQVHVHTTCTTGTCTYNMYFRYMYIQHVLQVHVHTTCTTGTCTYTVQYTARWSVFALLKTKKIPQEWVNLSELPPCKSLMNGSPQHECKLVL